MAGVAATSTKVGYKATAEATTYTNIPNLQEVPELGGDPEKIDVTCLADTVKKSIPGVKDLGDLAFKFLYDKTTFTTLSAITEAKEFQVEFPDGLTATFTAIPNVKMGGAAVNGALAYTVGMSLQSEILFA